MKAAFNFYSLIVLQRDSHRSRDVVDEEEGDIDDESDVELDGNHQLDLDLDSEHNNDNLESDRSTL